MLERAVAGTLFIALAQAAMQPPENSADSGQLVVKGKDFMIHALGGTPRDAKENVPVMDQFSFNDGIILVHTSLPSGKMKVLARGTSKTWRGPPMGVDRFYLAETGVTDFRADKERLYVLQFACTTTGYGRMPGRGERGDSTYSLLVYRVEDGVLIHTLHAKRSAKETVKRTEKGPLILRDNGVEVFGTRFEFNGTKLIKPVAEDMK